MRRRRERALVCTVCFLLAALLLLESVSTQIRLRSVENEIGALRRERETLEREKGILTARLANRISLEELEYRARELGMGRCRGDQIVELVIDGDDDEYK